MLNRATRSLTLYFQMIGRGSRVLPDKNEFTVVDLGNNLTRFGLWDAPIDWDSIFRNPDMFLSTINSDEEIERNYKYVMPPEVREKFPKSDVIDFDVKEEHKKALNSKERPKVVMEHSLNQQVKICMENSSEIDEALLLAELLKDEIDFRVRVFCRCLSKTSESYVKWLQDEYKRKLKITLIHNYQQIKPEEDEQLSSGLE